eukprot:g42961.t1
MGLWGDVGNEGRMVQCVPEGLFSVEGGQGRGGEYVSGGGISLEVAKMTSDDLLDVDAGGMVVKDKGNPITIVGGKRGGEGGSAGDGSDLVEGPVNNGAGESLVEEEDGHFGGSLVEVGFNTTYATEELGEWNGVFTGSRLQECIVQEVEASCAGLGSISLELVRGRSPDEI